MDYNQLDVGLKSSMSKWTRDEDTVGFRNNYQSHGMSVTQHQVLGATDARYTYHVGILKAVVQ
jgi:hypothetical protein